MVIAVLHSSFSGIFEVIVTILPAVGIKRGLGGQIRHTARRRTLSLGIIPFQVGAPVVVICIDICSVDEIQLACLKMIRRGYLLDIAVQGYHIAAQSDYSCAVLSAAEGEPACALIVDDNARVKGSFAAVQTLCIPVNDRLAQRVSPWPCGRICGKHSHSPAAV